jgi:hypothetical protein
VFYNPETSQLHAEHIILHELSHMLSGHTTGINAGRAVSGGTISQLVPDLDPRVIDTILGRAGYTTAQEREAEMLASLIRARAAHSPPAKHREPADTLSRVADALKFPS